MKKILLGLTMFFICAPTFAQEAWCLANSSNCVMSETFQSTAYNRVIDYGSGAGFLGTQANTKPGEIEGTTMSIQALFGGANQNTFAGTLAISTDSALLALLPNRNPTAVARFLRHGGDNFGSNQNSTYRFGDGGMTLGSARRLAFRWYVYHSPSYDFAYENSCTNGKMWEISAGSASPITKFQSYQNQTNVYDFVPGGFGGGPTPSWIWPGNSSWDGFIGGHNSYQDGPVLLSGVKGKWFRYEAVIRNPHATDSGGYDWSFFMKNVTDNTPEVEDSRFSAGCTGCMQGPANFVWNSGLHPVNDMTSFHTELYRAGSCAGWQGWLYAVIAKWDTDAGQRILAATEVEGGVSDITPPILSVATTASIGASSGTPRVTTNDVNGTLYMVLVPNGDTPSATQIKAGQRSNGTAAIAAQNQIVVGAGAQTMTQITGLSSLTTYTVWFLHRDAAGNDSTAISANFTTWTSCLACTHLPLRINAFDLWQPLAILWKPLEVSAN